MITNKVIPAHILRLYIYDLLKQEADMQLINGLVPILPIEDEPKVESTKMPYGIYGYTENSSGKNEQIRSGVFSIRFMTPTFAELGKFLNVIGLGFESCDIATEAVNRYSTTWRLPGSQDPILVGIRFTDLKVTYIEGGAPPDVEGGTLDGTINISYEYINELPNPVVQSAKGGLWS